MTQGKLKMIVEPYNHKNIDSLGDWDGTWDETFVYYIFGEDGYDVEKRGGYHTAEKAREAGEKALRRLEGKGMRGLFIKSVDYKLLCQLEGMGYTAVKQDIYFGGTMVTNDGKVRHPIAPYKPWNPDRKGWPECEVFDNVADFLKAAAEMIKEAK